MGLGTVSYDMGSAEPPYCAEASDDAFLELPALSRAGGSISMPSMGACTSQLLCKYLKYTIPK